eukprot:SM000075S21958  [mRNA]  locus=s75:280347:282690:- [translate_table: standard]
MPTPPGTSKFLTPPFVNLGGPVSPPPPFVPPPAITLPPSPPPSSSPPKSTSSPNPPKSPKAPPPPVVPSPPPPPPYGPPPAGSSPIANYPQLPQHPPPILPTRTAMVSLTDFGAVPDGVTPCTAAFVAAIAALAGAGGGQLTVPAGSWLTAPFNLTSHMTLFLAAGATIFGSQASSLRYQLPLLFPQFSNSSQQSIAATWHNFTEYPILPPYPSYGKGREWPNLYGRYQALIHGDSLVDVVITGQGTIDGQGSPWWSASDNKKLLSTRPELVQLSAVQGLIISGITLRNPPFWALHPIYCSDVHIHGLTILAPLSSPNTDGIDSGKLNHCPLHTWTYSCVNVLIEDCYISNGDDAICIKSGWDQYGIAYNAPSANVLIRSIAVDGSHGMSLGSEVSGGIYNVTVDGVVMTNCAQSSMLMSANARDAKSLCAPLAGDAWEQAIRIKSIPGRGGYVHGATFRNYWVADVSKAAIVLTQAYSSVRTSGSNPTHPDSGYNPAAITDVDGVVITSVVGPGVKKAGAMSGLPQALTHDVALADIALGGKWSCSDLQGTEHNVTPDTSQTCPQLVPV